MFFSNCVILAKNFRDLPCTEIFSLQFVCSLYRVGGLYEVLCKNIEKSISLILIQGTTCLDVLSIVLFDLKHLNEMIPVFSSMIGKERKKGLDDITRKCQSAC